MSTKKKIDSQSALILEAINKAVAASTDSAFKKKWQGIADDVTNNKEVIDTNDQSLMTFFNSIAGTPEAEALVRKELASAKLDFENETLVNGLRVLSDVGGIVEATKQIQTADRTLKGLTRPGVTPVPEQNRALTQALSESQRDVAAAGTLEGGLYDQQIDEGLQADLDVAQTASTGQAANYASNAQTAIGRRNRARSRGALVRQQARQQALANRNNLIGQRVAEDQSNFRNRQANTNLLEARYNRDADIANKLGSVGRQNRLNALGNLTDSVAEGVVDYRNSQSVVAPLDVGQEKRAQWKPFQASGNLLQDLDTFDQEKLLPWYTMDSYMPYTGPRFVDRYEKALNDRGGIQNRGGLNYSTQFSDYY